MTARIQPYGEGAVLVVLGDAVDLATARRARRLAAEVTSAATDGWQTPVQRTASVLVPFDPLIASADELTTRLTPLVDALPLDPGPSRDARLVDVPVRYGSEDGPDIDEVAVVTGLSVAQVVERHVAEVLEVLTLGFAPGFPYLGLIDRGLAVPRRATPRPRVAAGSVGLAGRMTGIYPADLPGGWRIIGRTALRLFDLSADPPSAPPARRPHPIRAGRSPMTADDVLEVIDGGLLTSVQDLRPAGMGRVRGAARRGMRSVVAGRRERRLRQCAGRARARVTLVPPTLRVLRATTLGLAGADLGLRLQRAGPTDRSCPDRRSTWRRATSSCPARRAGPALVRTSRSRAGSAARPGLLVDGARGRVRRGSTDGRCGPATGSRPHRHRPGPARPRRTPCHRSSSARWIPSRRSSCCQARSRGDPGDGELRRGFLAATWRVGAESDRIGLRLEGPPLEPADTTDIPSHGVTWGTIQPSRWPADRAARRPPADGRLSGRRRRHRRRAPSPRPAPPRRRGPVRGDDAGDGHRCAARPAGAARRARRRSRGCPPMGRRGRLGRRVSGPLLGVQAAR